MEDNKNNIEETNSTNPLQSVVNSSFFFRLNLRLLLALGGGACFAACIGGLMLRFFSGA